MPESLKPSTILSAAACALAGAALAVSLLHAGPRGPQGPVGSRGPAGPQGNAGKAAQTARLGLCWSESFQNSGTVTWVDGISLDQPVLSDGVYTCPQGDTFVSIVPQPTQAAG
jgi:hypothetical protein